MEEVWRIVEENPVYLVSNQNGLKENNTNLFLKGWNQRGYRYVWFKDKTKHPFHLLVAKAFPEICGKWFEGAVVHHKDGNKLNNVPENLIVISQKEHAALHYKTQPDSFKKPSEKRSKSISKSLSGKANFKQHKPVNQYTLDRKFIKKWECLSWIEGYNEDTGKKWDISTIAKCCRGVIKKAYGYIWEYENGD